MHSIAEGMPQRMLQAGMALPPSMRSPQPAGAPIILAPRMPTLSQAQTMGTTGLINSMPPPLVSPHEAGLVYPGYDPYGLSSPSLLEYQAAVEQSAAGTSYVR